MKITLVISGDSNYDRRLQKLCNSLVSFGFEVLLISVKKNYSKPLTIQCYQQKRLQLLFARGFLHYVELNCRLLGELLFVRTDVLVANDLETAMPVLFASVVRRKKRVIDLHELFCEMPELVRQPRKRKFWMSVERIFIRSFPKGYTVSGHIADYYKVKFGLQYEVIGNYPMRQKQHPKSAVEKYVLYQGAVVEGRCFKEMIEATRITGHKFYICGNGGVYSALKAYVEENNYKHVRLFGWVEPAELVSITRNAWIGLNILDDSKNNQFSCTNRFFDYLQAGLPQISSDYSVYRAVNEQFEVAVLIETPTVENIVHAIRALECPSKYEQLRENTEKAADIYTWNRQEPRLREIYSK